MLSLQERVAASNPVVSKALQLNAQAQAVLSSINVATFGVVVSITGDLLEVKPIINQKLVDNMGVAQNVGFSNLQDVPYSCDTPAKGDTVVLLFLDYDISGVITNGGTDSNGSAIPQNQQVVSSHALSNAVCIGILKNNASIAVPKMNYTGNTESRTNNGSGISNALISFIESYEGFYGPWYDDGFGTQTIGYGHTGALPGGWTAPLTQATATTLLQHDITSYISSVSSIFTGVSLNQNQFDSLVDFCYNLGSGALSGSTLTKDIKNGASDSQLKTDFDAYSHAGGKLVQGLLRRREAEWSMYTTGNYLNG